MIRPVKAILIRNLIKLKRNRLKLFMTLLMSGVFLFIFSFVMKSVARGIENPMNYLISGIIIMTVFQSSLTNSMNILEDISTGFMKEILVSPVYRWQIAIGHVLSSMIISVIQGVIIVVIALFMGLKISFIHGTVMLGLMFLVGLTFSSMGLYLATLAKESDSFQLIVMIATFPLTFLSGAYIPVTALPKILIPLVYLNPLTYATAAFRSAALHMENMPSAALVDAGVAFCLNRFIITPAISALIIFTMCILFFILCVKRFSKADFSTVRVFKRGH